MDEKNFDKLIKGEMHQTRDFEYKESLWNALNQKLRNGNNSTTNYWKWISLLLLVLLIISFMNPWKIGYFNSDPEPPEVKSKVPVLKSEIMTDTIYNYVSITKYDTIVRIRHINQTINKNSINNTNFL